MAVLTEDDVREIRALASSGLSDRHIATLYPVGRLAVLKIRRRQRWAHVE